MNVLIAIDSSESSQIVIQEMISRSWPAESRFEVLMVLDPAPLWTTTELMEQIQAGAQALVTKAAKQLEASGLKASATVLTGNPKALILDQATASRADLIMLGAQEKSTLERLMMGSVARTVLRHAPCSVEIVRPRARKNSGAFRILLCVDGSAGAQLATESVGSRPWPDHSEVRVFSVVELALSAFQTAFEIPALDQSNLERQRTEAMKRSEDAISAAESVLQAAGLKTSESISVLAEGPEQVVLAESANWAADLIILGSHGHGAVERFLIGSVSETVAMHASCSVEIVRKG